MLKDYLQIHNLSLVFLGDFNPTIIQPFWLSNKKLIGENEAINAKISIIHSELVQFELDWVLIEVTKNRFALSTSKSPYFDPLRDLGISIFKVLNDTPIKALGINHTFHYALTDENSYYNFGNKLAPFNNWDEFMVEPRLMNLEMIEKKRKDGLNGLFRVKVRSSEKKLSTKYGVEISFNDHFDFKMDEFKNNGEVIKVLSENWNTSLDRSNEIAENIWNKVNSK